MFTHLDAVYTLQRHETFIHKTRFWRRLVLFFFIVYEMGKCLIILAAGLLIIFLLLAFYSEGDISGYSSSGQQNILLMFPVGIPGFFFVGSLFLALSTRGGAWARSRFDEACADTMQKVIMEVLGTEVQHLPKSALESDAFEADITRSKLLPETTREHPHSIYSHIKSVYTTKVHDRPLTLTVVRIDTTENIASLFYGIYIKYKLKNTLSGTTYVSTETDDNRSYFNQVVENLIPTLRQYHETELEWNEFERNFYVASDEPVEARYIFTTDLMEDFYHWWLEHKQRLRIMFSGNEMHVLLPDPQGRAVLPPASTDYLTVKNYLAGRVLPLWRSIKLVQHIKI